MVGLALSTESKENAKYSRPFLQHKNSLMYEHQKLDMNQKRSGGTKGHAHKERHAHKGRL